MPGKMRQRGIMRQLSCYEFQNQRGRESVKSLLLHESLRLYFKITKKMTKRSHGMNGKGYLSCAICLFLVATAFLISLEIYWIIFKGNDLGFFSLLIKLFEHSNSKMWWYSLFFSVWQMKHLNFHWVEDLVVVFYF